MEKSIFFRNALEEIIENANTDEDDDSFYVSDESLLEYSKEFIIAHKTDIPRLYRYTDADYYSILGLEENTIHLSDIGKMNDVFELLSSVTNDITNNNSHNDIMSILGNTEKLLQIKSFSENCASLLMWATYAKNYSGICVEYDFTKADDFLLYHLFPVVYRKQRLKKAFLKLAESDFNDYYVNNEECNSDSILDNTVLGLVKSKSWEYENEWRLIFNYLHINELYKYAKNDFDNFELFYYDDFTIKTPKPVAVYLGPRIENTKRKHIIRICKNQSIDVFDMKLSDKEFKVEPYTVEYTELREE